MKCYAYIYMPHQTEIFLSRWTERLLHCGRYAKTSVIRSEKSLGFCHLIGGWRAEAEEATTPPRLVAMLHNYVSKRGDVRREAECDAGGQVDVGETSIYLTSSCTRVVRPSSGSAFVYWQKLHRNIPSRQSYLYALFSVTADERLKKDSTVRET